MTNNPSTFHLIKSLWLHINNQRRLQIVFLLLLMILASFAEVISIGAILPFLGVLTAPDQIFNSGFLHPYIHKIGPTSAPQLLLLLTIIFALAAMFAGVIRLLLIHTIAKLSFATGSDIAVSIYERSLYQPYTSHCARNSSELISAISGKTNSVIHSTILPFLNLVSAVFILVPILITIFYVDIFVAISTFFSFALIYLLIIKFTRKRILIDGVCVAHEGTQIIRHLNEGFGGIRDVLLDGSQQVFCTLFRRADLSLRSAQSRRFFISVSPRYIVEALGMVVIACVAYYISTQADGFAKVVPTLGILALGAQRLLPVLQQAYSAWVDIQGGRASLQDVLELLDQPLPDNYGCSVKIPLIFNNSIILKNVSFKYKNQAVFALKGIDLIISKGARIGFIGPTGSGKSTLLDVIMGLLPPTQGVVEVDGEAITYINNLSWQRHLAHVPQSIFLSDSSIEENIAFGVPKEQIDAERVREVAKQAQLAEVIESWPMKYQTHIGERGVRLSGGQRQRIGIARALYKRADVIIFDEATSSLDNDTEQAVMGAIEALSDDLTILIIAHRLTTLKNCNLVIELQDGVISRVGDYQQMIGHKNVNNSLSLE